MTLRERKKEANKEPLISTEHPELFHYTSLHALEGILETNTLWATHADHLNDSSEMKLLWPKLELQFIAYLKAAFEAGPGRDPEIREMAERHGGAAKISEMDGATITNIMRSLLLGSESRPGIGIPFVTSFTTHEKNIIAKTECSASGTDTVLTKVLQSFLILPGLKILCTLKKVVSNTCVA